MQTKIFKSNLKLIHGNCLEEMGKLKNNSIDLIAVDPPYGVTQNKWDIIIPFEQMWLNIKRVIKEKGIVVFTATQPYASQLILSNKEWFRYDLIWQKTIGSGQLNINKRPLRVHEHILVFYKKFGVYNEQKTNGKAYRIKRSTANFEGNYGRQRDHEKINTGFRHAQSVIKISNPRIKNGHRTEKPVELMEYIINTYSNEGDTVLDFACGRGTTGVACINLKRNFIGMELDEYWYNRTKNRFDDYKENFVLFS